MTLEQRLEQAHDVYVCPSCGMAKPGEAGVAPEDCGHEIDCKLVAVLRAAGVLP